MLISEDFFSHITGNNNYYVNDINGNDNDTINVQKHRAGTYNNLDSLCIRRCLFNSSHELYLEK